MLRLAADENFHGTILEGLMLRRPETDVVRIQDTPLYQGDDPDVLAWCASEERILLTHDADTLVGHAWARVASGEKMPGVFLVQQTASAGHVIEDLILLIECGQDGEYEGCVVYVPL